MTNWRGHHTLNPTTLVGYQGYALGTRVTTVVATLVEYELIQLIAAQHCGYYQGPELLRLAAVQHCGYARGFPVATTRSNVAMLGEFGLLRIVAAQHCGYARGIRAGYYWRNLATTTRSSVALQLPSRIPGNYDS